MGALCIRSESSMLYIWIVVNMADQCSVGRQPWDPILRTNSLPRRFAYLLGAFLSWDVLLVSIPSVRSNHVIIRMRASNNWCYIVPTLLIQLSISILLTIPRPWWPTCLTETVEWNAVPCFHALRSVHADGVGLGAFHRILLVHTMCAHFKHHASARKYCFLPGTHPAPHPGSVKQ